METLSGNTDLVPTLKHTHSLIWLTSTLCYQLVPIAKTTDWIQPQKPSSYTSGGWKIQDHGVSRLGSWWETSLPGSRWLPSCCVLMGLFLSMHTCTCSHMHTHAHTCSQTHTVTHAHHARTASHMFMRTCTCSHTFTHVCTPTHICMHPHVHTLACTCSYTHTHLPIYTRAHTCTHTQSTLYPIS